MIILFLVRKPWGFFFNSLELFRRISWKNVVGSSTRFLKHEKFVEKNNDSLKKPSQIFNIPRQILDGTVKCLLGIYKKIRRNLSKTHREMCAKIINGFFGSIFRNHWEFSGKNLDTSLPMTNIEIIRKILDKYKNKICFYNFRSSRANSWKMFCRKP